MLLAPVVSTDGLIATVPVTVRLIGVLDRVLMQSFSDACDGLAVAGPRTLVISVRDLLALQDENFSRFVGILEGYRSAGHDIRIVGNPTWKRMLRGTSVTFSTSEETDGRRARRQIIICHSTEKHTGAA